MGQYTSALQQKQRLRLGFCAAGQDAVQILSVFCSLQHARVTPLLCSDPKSDIAPWRPIGGAAANVVARIVITDPKKESAR